MFSEKYSPRDDFIINCQVYYWSHVKQGNSLPIFQCSFVWFFCNLSVILHFLSRFVVFIANSENHMKYRKAHF